MFRRDAWLRLLLTLSLVASVSPASLATGDVSLPSVEKRVWKAVNEYREAHGLPRLEWSEELARVARAHSQAMASGKTSFGHAGFRSRASEAELCSLFTSAAENVALNNREGASAVSTAIEGWVRSPGHRANIEGAYTVTGVGVARNARRVYYFTQIFVGAPMNGESASAP